MARNKRTYKFVGSFELTQPKMLISDPCYEKDEWCSKLVSDCKTGKWDAYINVNHYRYNDQDGSVYNDERVATLLIKHCSEIKEIFGTIHWSEASEDNAYIRWHGNWENLSENIGVDSGQAGFFDYEKYGDNSLFETDGKCGFGSRWYSNCCDETLNKHAGIIATCGVNASAGFGDGCYTVWGHRNEDKEIDAMVLFFLADNEPIDEEF